MDLFVNFRDAQRAFGVTIDYIAKERMVRILIGRRSEKRKVCIEIYDVGDEKIINKNIILKNYELHIEGDCITFKKSDDVANDSIYLLILSGKQEHIPFCRWRNLDKFELKYHIDCSIYHGLWFVRKHFIIELKESTTFGMCVPSVNEWLNEKFESIPKKAIPYFYRFTKKTVEAQNGGTATTWSFRRIDNKKREGEVFYRPIIRRM